jgi:hypothetical protein
VHDCLLLEAAGKPTAVICNRSFLASGRATARMLGVADYALISLPDLLTYLGAADIQRLAGNALDAVIDSLVARPPAGQDGGAT